METLQKTVDAIERLDQQAMDLARNRQDSLTKPQGSLGMLEELSIRLAGISKQCRPKLGRKVVVVMAGDHGVTSEGVSAFPSEVTPQMVLNFANGGAAINVLSRHAGVEVVVVDIGVACDLEVPGVDNFKVRQGSANMAEGPAMTRDEAIASLETGIEIAKREVANGATVIATGDMGIGNTTASSAILSALTGLSVDEVTGRGTGLDDEHLALKKRVIERALATNKPDREDPIDVLATVGGLEIGGIAGTIIGAAASGVPVVVDGFISGAGALLASRLAPQALDYMFASHVSVEPGHRLALSLLGLKPMFDLNMRLGEGTGAVLAIQFLEAAAKILGEMATFEEAAVSSGTLVP